MDVITSLAEHVCALNGDVSTSPAALNEWACVRHSASCAAHCTHVSYPRQSVHLDYMLIVVSNRVHNMNERASHAQSIAYTFELICKLALLT